LDKVSQTNDGILLIAVWSGDASAAGLRARLRSVGDVMSDAVEESTVAGRAAILEAVARWLDTRCL
jgi:hypothetical protein